MSAQVLDAALAEHWPYGITARCRCGKSPTWWPSLRAHVVEVLAEALEHGAPPATLEPVVLSDLVRPQCGCPRTANGGVRCHSEDCNEIVASDDARCWKCGTPRGGGTCPNPIERTDG